VIFFLDLNTQVHRDLTLSLYSNPEGLGIRN